MAVEQILLFVAAGLLLNLTPGPDVLYVVSSAARGGLRAGLLAALGISAGCFVHIFAAALGVTALLAASATAFTVLKWIGAAYLTFLGLQLLFARAKTDALQNMANPAERGSEGTGIRVFLRGFLSNALNPKVALFFLAFVPQFIPAGAENKVLAFLLLGLLFNFNSLWVSAGWAVVAVWLARRLRGASGSEPSMAATTPPWHWLQKAAGALFIGFGLQLAFSDNPPR